MSNSVEITGEITRILDKQTFSSGFEKQAIFVREDDGKYPQTFEVEFIKDKIEKVASLRVGDTATFTCNLNGREWEGHDRCFTSLSCWKIDNAGSNESTPASRAQDAHNKAKADGYAPGAAKDEAEDDIPF